MALIARQLNSGNSALTCSCAVSLANPNTFHHSTQHRAGLSQQTGLECRALFQEYLNTVILRLFNDNRANTKLYRKLRRSFATALFISLSTNGVSVTANEYNLPRLGDASSAIISPQQERKLGQSWLRAFRSQVPAYSDPLMYSYVSDLLTRLAQHSQLQDPELELVLVKNPSMNAFAVPGGVIGVHTGLFVYAESEGQLASVLAHELAHLSQRHYARSLEKQQQSALPTMAALLASLVLAATAGGDAGLAAMTATQAVALDAQLRFSRQNEQEADRIGMQTMVEAGEDPYAVSAMFERMLQATRYTQKPPEFLLTHPVTERRVADAMNRARKYPQKQTEDSLDFHLVRVRALMLHDNTAQDSVKRFAAEMEGESLNRTASRYGLVLALTKAHQLDRARETLAPLLQKYPEKDVFILADAAIDKTAGNTDAAIATLELQLKHLPNHHAYNVAYAETLMEAGRYARAEEVLIQHVKRQPDNEYLWYLLAEVHGLAGNILGVHEARAQYYVLNGVFDKAIIQLENALKLTANNYQKTAILQEKLRQVRGLQDERKL